MAAISCSSKRRARASFTLSGGGGRGGGDIRQPYPAGASVGGREPTSSCRDDLVFFAASAVGCAGATGGAPFYFARPFHEISRSRFEIFQFKNLSFPERHDWR